jgi:drug/metabolite transporter (DMT)-like permease
VTRLRADLLLLVTAATWGVAFYFQKEAMASVGPLTFIAARSFVAVIALAPLAVLERRALARPVRGEEWRTGMLAGVVFLLAAWLQQHGLITATVTNSGFLTALYVVVTPFMAWLLLQQKPSPIVWPSAAFCFVGTWLLGGGTYGAFSFGDALVACSALFWALHVVVLAGAARFEAPITLNALQFALVGTVACVAAVLLEAPTIAGISAAWSSILFVGLLASAVTFTLFTWAVRYTPAPEAAIIVGSESLFAALAGALLLGERLSPISWSGAAIIVAATLLLQVRPRGRA